MSKKDHIITKEEERRGDIERIKWTLAGGPTSIRRIYATVKHLRSSLDYPGVVRLVNDLVRAKVLETLSHPLHENQYFYSLAQPITDE